MTSKQARYFREWYENNRDKLNSYRKKRYHTDPEYREKVMEQARANARSAEKDPGPSDREFGSITVSVYSTNQAAHHLGISGKSLRAWLERGHVPVGYETPGGHVYFTEHQLQLMFKIKEVMDAYPPNSLEKQEKLREVKDYVYTYWWSAR